LGHQIKLKKCYFLRAFDPCRRAPYLVVLAKLIPKLQ
jgi:hypothetical protein